MAIGVGAALAIGGLVLPTLLNQLFPQTQKEEATRTDTQSGTQTNTGSRSATTEQFSPDIMKALDSILLQGLGSSGTGAAQTAIADRLKAVQGATAQPTFDVNSFVNGVVGQARVRAQAQEESGINSILSATGSSEGDNSMSALLASRIRADTDANLAGIEASSRATGEEIRRNQMLADSQISTAKTEEIAGLSKIMSDQILNMLNIAKGATTTATESSRTHQQTQATSKIDTSGKSVNREAAGTQIGNILGLFQGSALAA